MQRILVIMHTYLFIATQWMKFFSARGATDVTGYGLQGAASSLVKAQQQDLDFVIHNLPVIAKMAAVNKVVGNAFNLTLGLSPETSGLSINHNSPQRCICYSHRHISL